MGRLLTSWPTDAGETHRHESDRVCAADGVHDVDDDGGEVGGQGLGDDVAGGRPGKQAIACQRILDKTAQRKASIKWFGKKEDSIMS